jgi:hypothetical protein
MVHEKYRHCTFWTEARVNFVKVLKPAERFFKRQHFDFFIWGYPEMIDAAIPLVCQLQMLGYFYLPECNLKYTARNEVELIMTVLRKDSKTYRSALHSKGMIFICSILLYYISSTSLITLCIRYICRRDVSSH